MSQYIDIAKLLAARQIRFGKGQISLFNQPVFIGSIEWLVLLQEELHKRKMENSIYFAMKELTLRWMGNIHKDYRISGDEVLPLGANTLALAGLGEVSPTQIGIKEKPPWRAFLKNSSIAKICVGANRPVCHYIRGAIAAGAIMTRGKKCDAIETHCLAQGFSQCEFIAMPTKMFNKHDKLVKEQLSH